MDTIFMNSKNSKSSHPQRLILNLSDEMDFQRGEKIVVLSNHGIY